MERRDHGSEGYEKDGDPYLLYSKDQTPAGCGARQENKGISEEGSRRASFHTAPYPKYVTGIREQRPANGGLSYRLELLIRSRVCQGPGVTEKAKVPVRGGDAPAPVYR